MLSVENVSKSYGAFKALDKVSFAVNPGEIVGLLGPNGSGKTTLLRIIATYFQPQEGAAAVAGFDVRRQPLDVRRRIGYLPEGNILYDQMRVDDFLSFVAAAKGLTGKARRERLAWCVEQCELAPMLTKRCGQCSRGMKQRVALAAALVNDPPVLLLDEPTAGLDPLQSLAFRRLLASLSPNRTILFSSHIMGEVAAICGRVLVLHGGSLRGDLTLADGERRGDILEQKFLAALQSDAGGA